MVATIQHNSSSCDQRLHGRAIEHRFVGYLSVVLEHGLVVELAAEAVQWSLTQFLKVNYRETYSSTLVAMVENQLLYLANGR